MTQRLLDRLIDSLTNAAANNSQSSFYPVAVLWTDKERQWEGAVRYLRAFMPQLLTLGQFDTETRSGPAIWLKTVIAGLEPQYSFPSTPIIYLPGVSRTELRAIEHCSREIQPLAELQYRGLLWSQANSKDWTVLAFLSSKNGGLGFNVSQDRATTEALYQTLEAGVLLEESVEELQGRQINSEYLLGLLAPNPIRDVLTWLDDSTNTKTNWTGVKWDVFLKQTRSDFGFDPASDGPLVAAELLAKGQGRWSAVAQLYKDSYANFPGVFKALSSVQVPQLGLFPDTGILAGYPQANTQAELNLKSILASCAGMEVERVREMLREAEAEHGFRRQWLWAKMGEAPFAIALRHLLDLAEGTQNCPTGESPEVLAASYQNQGWKVDEAALRAMSCIRSKAEQDIIGGVVRVLYLPWLDESARRLQTAVAAVGGTTLTNKGPDLLKKEPGLSVIFVDGLRYDVACSLTSRLNEFGKAALQGRWTSLPSVTASGKAWCSPVADKVSGQPEDSEFQPRVAGTEKSLSGHNFRKLLEDEGVQVLSRDDIGSADGCAWTECGDLDHYGHEHGIRLARDLNQQLDAIQERIAELIDAGWKKFRIVTDHGWLLMPGGLPKAELAKHQAETKWGRCAVLKSSAQSDGLTFGWDWCKEVQIAYPPGIASFKAGEEYSHGGISFQESLVPIIELQVESTSDSSAVIKSVTWRGLRCNIEVASDAVGLMVDLRTKPAVADSTIVASTKLIESGKGSLAVVDDSFEGQAAVLVVLDAKGNVIQKQATTVGG